jgi:hypothetical protein
MNELRKRIQIGEFSAEELFPTDANLNRRVDYCTARNKVEELTYQLAQAKESIKTIKNKMRNDYNRAKFELIAKFREACEKEFGTVKYTQKIRDIIWSTAWERGHSAGYSEVLNEYADAAEFAHQCV